MIKINLNEVQKEGLWIDQGVLEIKIIRSILDDSQMIPMLDNEIPGYLVELGELWYKEMTEDHWIRRKNTKHALKKKKKDQKKTRQSVVDGRLRIGSFVLNVINMLRHTHNI